MIAAMNGRPSVVFPSTLTRMRGLAASSFVKYSTTCAHDGQLPVGAGLEAEHGRGRRHGGGACCAAARRGEEQDRQSRRS